MVIYYVKNARPEKENYLDRVLRDYYIRHAKHEEYDADFCTLKTFNIDRTNTGKPYLTDLPDIKFSVTHTEDRWLCAVSEFDIGIDCELLDRPLVRYEDIARRYFCCQETMLISEKGRKVFLRVWTRKEAFLKYTGGGLGAGLSSFCVVKDDQVLDFVPGENNVYYLEPDVAEDLMTVVCTSENPEDITVVLKTLTEGTSYSDISEAQGSKWNTRILQLDKRNVGERPHE